MDTFAAHGDRPSSRLDPAHLLFTLLVAIVGQNEGGWTIRSRTGDVQNEIVPCGFSSINDHANHDRRIPAWTVLRNDAVAPSVTDTNERDYVHCKQSVQALK